MVVYDINKLQTTDHRWRPCWCPKTMKRPPCWCPKPVLWELNSSYKNTFFCSNKFAYMLATWTLYRLQTVKRHLQDGFMFNYYNQNPFGFSFEFIFELGNSSESWITKAQESKTLADSGCSSKMTLCKWPMECQDWTLTDAKISL